MQVIEGNLWDFNRPMSHATWVVIPTNGDVRNDGACVMGRGVALQAKQKYPHLPYELGDLIKTYGNVVFSFIKYDIITFPVKDHWKDNANLKLIERSTKQLLNIINRPIYLPRVGCGNGRLSWDDVAPILHSLLDDRFTLVEHKVGN